jgi:hypothetical protein
MSLSQSKCWYSRNCLHFLKCTVPLCVINVLTWEIHSLAEKQPEKVQTLTAPSVTKDKRVYNIATRW